MSDPNTQPSTDLSLVEKFPVLVLGGVTLIITTLMSALVEFGIPLDEAKQSAISRVVEAIGGLVILVLLYRRMTSSAKVVSRVTNDGRLVAGQAAVEATGTELVTAADPLMLPVALATVKPSLMANPVPDLPFQPLTEQAFTAHRRRVYGPDDACAGAHPGEECRPGQNHPGANFA